MQRGRRVWWVAAACAVVILAAIAWIVHVKRYDSVDIFFATALRQEHIKERVVVDGIVYAVSDGQVVREGKGTVTGKNATDALRIAYALAITRRNPLLSLEGTDPDRLERAIVELQSVQQALHDAQAEEADARAVGSALYPIEFLKTAARVERARRLFLKTGDQKDWEAYRLVQTETARAYDSDARRFEQAFIETVPSDAEKINVVGGGKILSRESELAAIAGIKHNAGLVRKALEARSSCVSGTVSACEESDIALPIVETNQTTAASSTSLALAEEVEEILIQSTLAPSQNGTERPAAATKQRPVELSQSFCINSSAASKIFSVREQKNENGAEVVFVSLISNIPFIKASSFAGTRYFDYLLSKGIEFVPLWLTSTYTCAELGSDYGVALVMLSVDESVRTHPFSALLKNNTLQLAQVEKMISDAPVIRESDIRRYLALVRESILLDPSAPAEVRNEYVSFALQLRDRGAGSADLMYRLAAENNAGLKNGQSGIPVRITASYLFFARSAFFSLFMGHNPSFAPERVPPYESTSLPNTRQPYLRYSEIRSSVPHKKLIHDINYMMRLEDWNY